MKDGRDQRHGPGTERVPAASSEATQGGSDRRRADRRSATFAVSESEAHDGDAGHGGHGGPDTCGGMRIHLCQAEDIALGGITIKHAQGLTHEPRTEVSLKFALPGSREEIVARGEIVSDARAGRFRRTGVRFIAVRPEHQQLIAAYCLRR